MIDVKNSEQCMSIPQERYEHLLDLETRVDVVVEIICHNEYCKTEDILRILGTGKSMKKAEEIRKKDEEERKETLRKYSEEALMEDE